jgi:hypothetical protein
MAAWTFGNSVFPYAWAEKAVVVVARAEPAPTTFVPKPMATTMRITATIQAMRFVLGASPVP